MSLIPPNRSGAGWVSGSQFNRLREAVVAQSMPSGAPGMRRRIFAGGTILTPIPQKQSRRGSPGPDYPLDLSLTDAGTDFTGVFRPGTLNGKLPSNYTSLTGIAKTGVVFIVLTGTMNDGQPAACTFSAESSAPDGYPVQIDVPPTTLEILTHVVADGQVFRVLGPSSITASVVESFRTAKSTTGPGERTFNSYYTYEVDSG